jgi:hypothetical protein
MTKADRANVNVTLGLLGSGDGSLLGRQFPCPVCGAAMLIRLTVKQKAKPYCHCLSCGIQIFFRGKLGIQRLETIIESGMLISGGDSITDSAVLLYNRLQLLKTQKLQLEEKRKLFSPDGDLEKLINIFASEIKNIQTKLNAAAKSISGDKS